MQQLPTFQHVRSHNIRSVFDAIAENQPLSRVDIAHMFDLSPASVTRVVNRLMEVDLVEETRVHSTAGRGRKAVGLQMCASAMYIAGIGVAQSSIKVCMMDFCETILAEKEISLPGEFTADNLAQAVVPVVQAMVKQTGINRGKLLAAGIAIPGVVSHSDGIAHRSDLLSWTDVPVAQIVSQALGCATYLENDVNACLLSERSKRGMTDDMDAVYLFVDRGMGIAMSANGKLVRGLDNRAGELDRIPVEADTAMQDHLLEKYIIARAQKAEPSVLTLDDLFTAYRMKLSWARWIIQDLRSHLITVLSMVQGLCAPHALILGGSVIEHFYTLLESELPENAILSTDFIGGVSAGAALCARKYALQSLIIAQAMKG